LISKDKINAISQPLASPTEFQQFNLRDNIKDLDETFWNCFLAVLYKRASNYRRNYRALFNEVALPAIIMVLGFSAAILAPKWEATSRVLLPDLLPLK